MNLQRLIDAHHDFASSIEGHMSRLWARDLTEGEINTIRSYVVCDSFMSLEALDNRLAYAGSSQIALSDFIFMKSQGEKRSSEVVELVRQRFAPDAHVSGPNSYPNLLAWEEAILNAGHGP